MGTKLRFKEKGSWDYIDNLLDPNGKDYKKLNEREIYEKYGELMSKSLASRTPSDTGKTADSWSWTLVDMGKGKWSINFFNSNVTKQGECIALLIENGHVTKDGNWVEGRPFIDDALDPYIDMMYEELDIEGLEVQ